MSPGPAPAPPPVPPTGQPAQPPGRTEPAVRLVRTAAELRALPRRGERFVVMTMGALHEGHATLIRTAREQAGPEGQIVVTVFVNPLQFGAGEDLDRYPRTLDADLAVAGEAGADAVLAPSAEEVYPGGAPQVRISAGPIGERLEGAARPGHFDGMLTVVAKMLHLTAPDVALYGEKDAQQLALIARMTRDLNFPVRIGGVPTVREADGLALSSRNRYLSAADRRTALALSRALAAGRAAGLRAAAGDAGPNGPTGTAVRSAAPDTEAASNAEAAPDAGAPVAAAAGDPRPAPSVAQQFPGAAPDAVGDPEAVRAAARAVLDAAARREPPLVLGYLALVDPSDFTEIPAGYTGEAVLAVAAEVGTTRLIDNIRLQFGATR